MDEEQRKICSFFDAFIGIGRQKKFAIISIIIWLIILFAGSSIPAKDVFINTEEFELIGLLPMSMSIMGMFAAYMRISPYETYNERINSMGSVIVLLQYHPINKKKILKFKILHQIRFLAKIAFLCLGLQLLVTYIMHRTVSWMNVGYIFLFVFLVPAFFEGILMWFRDRYLYGE